MPRCPHPRSPHASTHASTHAPTHAPTHALTREPTARTTAKPPLAPLSPRACGLTGWLPPLRRAPSDSGAPLLSDGLRGHDRRGVPLVVVHRQHGGHHEGALHWGARAVGRVWRSGGWLGGCEQHAGEVVLRRAACAMRPTALPSPAAAALDARTFPPRLRHSWGLLARMARGAWRGTHGEGRMARNHAGWAGRVVRTCWCPGAGQWVVGVRVLCDGAHARVHARSL